MSTQIQLLLPRAYQFTWPSLSLSFDMGESAHFKSRYPHTTKWESKSCQINSRSPLLIYQSEHKKSLIKTGNSESLFTSSTASEADPKEDDLFPPKALLVLVLILLLAHESLYELGPGKDSSFNGINILKVLKNANSFLPHVVVASTLLALVFPPSFTWFTNRFYAPALGFLMFAVGINSSAEDFILAIKRPKVLASGYIGQYIIKPLLGLAFGRAAVTVLHLPDAIGSGIILTSCVSGAQLSNYATFLTEPTMAPLSIVMTALSTASAVVVTPMLTLLLLGKRLPVDVQGMMSSIMQIVVAPVAAGLLLNK